MKSYELMIGDWILLKSVDYADGVIRYVEEKKRVHVDILSRLEKQETKVVRDDCVYSIQVEPIELTREILRKNGFCKDDDAVWAAHCPEDKNFDLEISEPNYYDEGNPNRIIAWTINCCEYCILQFKYVHELQHAIKLCGINKTIEL